MSGFIGLYWPLIGIEVIYHVVVYHMPVSCKKKSIQISQTKQMLGYFLFCIICLAEGVGEDCGLKVKKIK